MHTKKAIANMTGAWTLYLCVILSLMFYAIDVFGQDPLSQQILQRGVSESFNISPTTVYGFIIFILFVTSSVAIYFVIKTNKQYIESLKEDRKLAQAALQNNTEAMRELKNEINDMSAQLTGFGTLVQNFIFSNNKK